ncbi:hypothetical protein QYE76_041497 [Lolium multiflorum]|uniref:F-box domain-containing protein n=1 Tax=Lolium multiflorum TaxID=4521 RepID=A0AAD8TDI1_LOLMU|nr:hypothetical protein QYE76_041497 [Lolium multiflorum]
MSAHKNAKVEFTSSVNLDRLTSLPEGLKCNILSRLNVQEAVRTSILSSAWRNAWTTMPEILLCDCTFAKSKFITLVDMVLSLHKGPLFTFTISGKERYHDVFDRWMLRLSMNLPSYVTIELTTGPKYKIPSSLFSIGLEHLYLKNCIISLPRVFQGFDFLTVLDLDVFSTTDKNINNLVSCCPMLSMLRLCSFEGIKCLNIQARKLECLEVNGMFEDIHLDAPNLKEADVTLLKCESYQSVAVDRGKSYMKQALDNLRYIETLSLNGYILTYLSKGCIHSKLSAVFDHLESIWLEICFWDPREVLTAGSLFHNAPMLKVLELRSFPWNEKFGPVSTWDQDQASIEELTLQMDHLVTVIVTDFLGLGCEVSFIGKLLSWAPVLEEVKIEGKRKIDEIMVLKKLLALPRVSQKAKVVVA